MNNGDKFLNNIKEIISKCCGLSDFNITSEKHNENSLIFKVYSNGTLNINLDQLITRQEFNICFEKCRVKISRSSNTKIKINSSLFFESCFFEEIDISNVCFSGKFQINQFDNIKKQEEMIKDITFNNCVFFNFILEKNKIKNNIYFKQKTKIKKMYLYENEFEKYFFIKECLIGDINLWKNKFKNRCYFIDSMF
ncbi:hypothetical protein HW743_001738, partial [Campylobacter jejuni]|nr:hypothetical protein [Campylobacter jejuni]EIQ2362581.1 hypothetical protein [Campylobacter jejuni]